MAGEKRIIEEIIEKFGGRFAGSPEEFAAQGFFAERLSGICDRVIREPFFSALTSMHGSLKIFCGLFWLSLLIARRDPGLALVLSAANALLMLTHFIFFGKILDFAFDKQRSENVTGVIEPSGKAERILIISGHMDSTTEYQWWFAFKNLGGVLSALAGLLILSFPLLLAVHYALTCFSPGPCWTRWYLDVFTGLSPLCATLFFMRSEKVVDGAQDNLSGIAVAFACAKELSGKARPEGPALTRTRVLICSFGAEEAGLNGSSAWVKAHLAALPSAKTVCVNLDGVMLESELRIIKAEIFPLVRYPEHIVCAMKEAFTAAGVEPKVSVIPMGATDAVPFARKKIPAVSIIGLPVNGLHETYHTRLDRVECVEEGALAKAAAIVCAFAKKLDEE
ncbi:MAG: M20/M25/M40 family metallo-hydrolase [Thermodesulfobacteriota bacterium]